MGRVLNIVTRRDIIRRYFIKTMTRRGIVKSRRTRGVVGSKKVKEKKR